MRGILGAHADAPESRIDGEVYLDPLALCNRLRVIARGRLSPSLPRSLASVERVGAWMSGLWEAEAGPAAA